MKAKVTAFLLRDMPRYHLHCVRSPLRSRIPSLDRYEVGRSQAHNLNICENHKVIKMKQNKKTIPLEKKRNHVVVTKVSKHEYDKICFMAKRCGMSISGLVRARCLDYKPTYKLSPEDLKRLKNLADCRTDMVNFANALSGLTNEEKLALFRNHRMMLQWYEMVSDITKAVADYLRSVQKVNEFPTSTT